MSYQWIDIGSIPRIGENQTVIVFGAGNGFEEFRDYLAAQSRVPAILAVVDNDPTMWGKYVHGIKIYEPAGLTDFFSRYNKPKIIITTVSGKESVSEQLREMNFQDGVDFFNIGCFPDLSIDNAATLFQMNERFHFLKKGLRVLHVGPGGFLGFECALAAYGCTMASIDAYSFSLKYPFDDASLLKYKQAKQKLLSLAADLKFNTKTIAKSWDSLFHKNDIGEYILDPGRITYLYPFRFSELPFQDASLDLVTSFAVLEHVRAPDSAIHEIHRVLKPGGYSFQKIITRDHRSFGAVGNYTPTSYMNYSASEWEQVNKNKFYQNRLTPYHWKEKFSDSGFDMVANTTLETYPIPDDEFQSFDHVFKRIPRTYLEETACLLLHKKL